MSGLIFKEDISIVLGGEAGQGIQTMENILVRVIKFGGYHVFSAKEYMSRVRGGENSTAIRVSSKRVTAYVDKIDLLVSLSKGAIDHLRNRISDETIIIGDKKSIKVSDGEMDKLIDIPFSQMASEIGSPIFSNIIAAGVISSILGVDQAVFDKCIAEIFSGKGQQIIQKDLEAGRKGYGVGQKLLESGKIAVEMEKDPKIKDELLLNGTEAVGMGCLAGGCNFMSSYPMTPSTPLQVFIAENSENFGIIFEQAEDEIAAINMAIGAFYAGARSMIATSGSGFALMEEAVGLSGMIETPVVIYIGQRPGPAVGLPTRTAQEDLNLALYSGPGEFPRIIFAPGKFEDAFKLSQMAFNLADKYQIPVFILSDQYFADYYHNLPGLDLKDLKVEDSIVKTNADYKRYQITDDGISPRGIPGFGEGLVVVDSDEHDEEGHLTEDLDLRTRMVDKRLQKMEKIQGDIVPPELIGGPDYEILIVGWGSTYGAVREAMDKLSSDKISGSDKVAFLHFKQVYPLHPDTKNYLQKAEKTIIFENNATAQFAKLLKLETGFDIDKKVLKYNGMPFSVEETQKEILENLDSMGGI
jgi:2-oxoglutarate/2-oxoacid ferredoxin oxidoreductase subunit alpha